MRGVRSRRGRSSTTRSARTAVWDTARRQRLRRRMQQASTRLSERQGIQTPSLAPRAPPYRLKPKMEQQKVVVFLRERKQGAGQAHAVWRQTPLTNNSQACAASLMKLPTQ